MSATDLVASVSRAIRNSRQDASAEDVIEAATGAGRRSEGSPAARRMSPLMLAASWDAVVELVFRDERYRPLRPTLLEEQSLAPRMRLVSRVVSLSREANASSAPYVLACRHLLGSSVSELLALREIYPDATVVGVMGKPYSANRLVVEKLETLGFPVVRSSAFLTTDSFGRHAETHRVQAEVCADRLLGLELDPKRPILVMDDGGALINAVARKAAAAGLKNRLIAVEQTTHGLYGARGVSQIYPNSVLVNVAESYSKLEVETSLVASSIIACAREWIATLGLGRSLDDRSFRVGLVGFGSVGLACALELRKCGVAISIHDRNPHKNSMAHALGFATERSPRELLARSDLVLCCTGGSSIEPTDLPVDGHELILASASSGDIEFRRIAGHLGEPETLGVSCTDAFRLAHGRRRGAGSQRLTVCGAGFPVNFDGSVDPIAPRAIQHTRALMLLGAVEGLSHDGRENGIVELSARGQRALDIEMALELRLR